MRRGAIEIHVDELVVDGLRLDDAAAAAVRRAVEHGLAELVAAHGLPPSPDASPAPVTLAPLARATAARPDFLGAAVARGVFEALRGGTPRLGGRS
jgi:hypothetical protein